MSKENAGSLKAAYGQPRYTEEIDSLIEELKGRTLSSQTLVKNRLAEIAYLLSESPADVLHGIDKIGDVNHQEAAHAIFNIVNHFIETNGFDNLSAVKDVMDMADKKLETVVRLMGVLPRDLSHAAIGVQRDLHDRLHKRLAGHFEALANKGQDPESEDLAIKDICTVINIFGGDYGLLQRAVHALRDIGTDYAMQEMGEMLARNCDVTCALRHAVDCADHFTVNVRKGLPVPTEGLEKGATAIIAVLMDNLGRDQKADGIGFATNDNAFNGQYVPLESEEQQTALKAVLDDVQRHGLIGDWAPAVQGLVVNQIAINRGRKKIAEGLQALTTKGLRLTG